MNVHSLRAVRALRSLIEKRAAMIPVESHCMWLSILLLFLVGCSEREKVGGGYALVAPESLGPDSHPGTLLHRNGETVWNNVYVGYFGGKGAEAKFYHDGIFVFVGPVPGNTDWWYYSQLFAVRGSGPPVVLSERLLGEPLVISYDLGNPGSRYAVETISPMENGIRVKFTHNLGSINLDTNSIVLSWQTIGSLLDESEKSARLVRHKLGDYRILPFRSSP